MATGDFDDDSAFCSWIAVDAGCCKGEINAIIIWLMNRSKVLRSLNNASYLVTGFFD